MPTTDTRLPLGLINAIAVQCERPAGIEAALLANNIRQRFGDSLLAVILYGSCLRTHLYTEGVVDLYVVVNSYQQAYSGHTLRYLNAALPPNVFYIEINNNETIIRAKYAVISARDLERGCGQWFHSYIWSRFAQPVVLLYVRDPLTREHIYKNLACAVLTLLSTTLPALGPGKVDHAAIWQNGLALTYAAELRPERHTRARDITAQNLDDFGILIRKAAPALVTLMFTDEDDLYERLSGQTERSRATRLWRIRRWQGFLLSVLRLSKAAYTFRDCVDYAAWKIERHTGIRIHVTPTLQRHPILFGFSVLWQLIKRDVLH